MNAESSVETAPARAVGRPFQPGVSGNPGGRPKAIVARIREQTNDGAEVVDFLVQVVREPDGTDQGPHRGRGRTARPRLRAGADSGRRRGERGRRHSLMALARRLSAQDAKALRARARDYDVDGEAIEG